MNVLELLIAGLLTVNQTPEIRSHNWKLIDAKHWQLQSANPIQPQPDLSGGVCPPGMVHVKGNMKQDPDTNAYSMNTIEEMQKRTCDKWITKVFPERCQEFNRDKWLAMSANLKTKPMDFCEDQFEYPNHINQYPVIFVNWWEAKRLCEAQGKKLPDEEEWTFACEGEEAKPYEYGYSRDDTACVIDKPWHPYHPSQFHPRNADTTMLELDRLWQGETSGSRAKCKSDFGVYDLTGNIDEWSSAVKVSKFKSVLNGGYWGRVRTRCRAKTRSHNENHLFYQQGFRCSKSLN